MDLLTVLGLSESTKAGVTGPALALSPPKNTGHDVGVTGPVLPPSRHKNPDLGASKAVPTLPPKLQNDSSFSS